MTGHLWQREFFSTEGGRLGGTRGTTPPLSVKAPGGGRCEAELPALTELLGWFLRAAAVGGILGPTVLGLSRFQRHLAHQLLDRERQQPTSHKIRSNPTHKMLQV